MLLCCMTSSSLAMAMETPSRIKALFPLTELARSDLTVQRHDRERRPA